VAEQRDSETILRIREITIGRAVPRCKERHNDVRADIMRIKRGDHVTNEFKTRHAANPRSIGKIRMNLSPPEPRRVGGVGISSTARPLYVQLEIRQLSIRTMSNGPNHCRILVGRSVYCVWRGGTAVCNGSTTSPRTDPESEPNGAGATPSSVQSADRDATRRARSASPPPIGFMLPLAY